MLELRLCDVSRVVIVLRYRIDNLLGGNSLFLGHFLGNSLWVECHISREERCKIIVDLHVRLQ